MRELVFYMIRLCDVVYFLGLGNLQEVKDLHRSFDRLNTIMPLVLRSIADIV